jgi:RnfH family Ubiquitin
MTEPIKVCLAYSPRAAECLECELVLCARTGTSARDALARCLAQQHQAATAERGHQQAVSDWQYAISAAFGKSFSLGVWGKKAPLDQALNHGDRLEIYRPLRVDPMTARRERFQQQGRRKAGLFERKK